MSPLWRNLEDKMSLSLHVWIYVWVFHFARRTNGSDRAYRITVCYSIMRRRHQGVLSWHSNSLFHCFTVPLALSLLSCFPPRVSHFSPVHQVMKVWKKNKKKKTVMCCKQKNSTHYIPLPPVIMSRAECVLSKLNSGLINKPLCRPLVLIRSWLVIFHAEIVKYRETSLKHKMLLRQYSLQLPRCMTNWATDMFLLLIGKLLRVCVMKKYWAITMSSHPTPNMWSWSHRKITVIASI